VTAKIKTVLSIIAVWSSAIVTLWCPYRTAGVPEWKLQVIDVSGTPLAHVTVNQEWLNPIEDGIVGADSRNTDASGTATFPARVLHNRLALGFARSKPSARIFVCWQNQYGDVDWDGLPGDLPKLLNLKSGPCPYN
jgi:hypothetical protein